jgi:cation:H+ antiporter
LILGLAALLRPFTVHSDILRRELPLMLLVSLLAGWCCTMDNCPVSTAFLLALALLWLLFTIKIARLAERQGSDSLTREQLAELPRKVRFPSPCSGWA